MPFPLSHRILPNPSENNKGRGSGELNKSSPRRRRFTCVLHRLNRELSSDQRINGPSDQVRYCSFCASLTGAPPTAGERQRKGIGSAGHRWSVGRLVGWSDDSSRQSPIKRKCQVAIESSACQIEIRCHFIIQQEPRLIAAALVVQVDASHPILAKQSGYRCELQPSTKSKRHGYACEQFVHETTLTPYCRKRLSCVTIVRSFSNAN